MSDITSLVTRYGIPGLPVALSLYLTGLLAPYISGSIETSDVLLLLLMSVVLGYAIQQIWMLIFDYSPLRYDSPKRPPIHRLDYAAKENAFTTSWNLPTEKRPRTQRLYVIWEILMYFGDSSDPMRAKLMSMWDFFHAIVANGIGLIIAGALFSYANSVYCSDCTRSVDSPFVGPIISIVGVVLILKARQTWQIIGVLEGGLASLWLKTAKWEKMQFSSKADSN